MCAFLVCSAIQNCYAISLSWLQVVLSCGALQHFPALLTHSKEKIKKVWRKFSCTYNKTTHVKLSNFRTVGIKLCFDNCSTLFYQMFSNLTVSELKAAIVITLPGCDARACIVSWKESIKTTRKKSIVRCSTWYGHHYFIIQWVTFSLPLKQKKL